MKGMSLIELMKMDSEYVEGRAEKSKREVEMTLRNREHSREMRRKRREEKARVVRKMGGCVECGDRKGTSKYVAIGQDGKRLGKLPWARVAEVSGARVICLECWVRRGRR